jgi:ribosomal protein S18 acetylase RimI-like enzyme
VKYLEHFLEHSNEIPIIGKHNNNKYTLSLGYENIGEISIDYYSKEGYINSDYPTYNIHLSSLLISDNFRRKGYAEYLMKEILEEFKKIEVRFITLSVNIYNIPAVKLYKKLGFKFVDNVKYYNGYDPSGNKELLMIIKNKR